MKEILTQEEYKALFNGEKYIKSEYYIDYLSKRLSEEFELKYNEKKDVGILNGLKINVLLYN